jgi:hypothetical protein
MERSKEYRSLFRRSVIINGVAILHKLQAAPFSIFSNKLFVYKSGYHCDAGSGETLETKSS